MNREGLDMELLSLKRAVQRKVESDSLHSSQLDELRSLQRTVLSPEKRSGSINSVKIACMICIVLCTGVFLWLDQGQPERQVIAEEVVKNHLKQRPMELITHSMSEVERFFTELDFSPAVSEQAVIGFNLAESALLGARYCSIQGVTAAQLRYLTPSGGGRTLYEVRYDPEKFGPMPMVGRGEQPLQMQVKGLKVSLWVEKGLLFALIDGI